MSELLRFGLIGCGRVAPRHAQSIAELPGARLTAVADIRESRASRFAAEHRADQYTGLSAPAGPDRRGRGEHLRAQRSPRAGGGGRARGGEARHRREADRAFTVRCRSHDRGRAVGRAQAVRGAAEPLQPPHAGPQTDGGERPAGAAAARQRDGAVVSAAGILRGWLARHLGHGRRRADESVHPSHRRAPVAAGPARERVRLQRHVGPSHGGRGHRHRDDPFSRGVRWAWSRARPSRIRRTWRARWPSSASAAR